MPFADYVDFDDCVSKNTGKVDNPAAYCAVIKQKTEAYNRHWDFQRIYNEFKNVYEPSEADQLYHNWLKVMGLDETMGYAQARESYLWKKDDLQFIREDADNKYYEVEVGFPTKSMNGNVYKQRDLIAASLTLKGKHPSLNHKNEFWFSPKNPHNRWGNIEIVDGRFHEGISKALIKVPKSMVCPICDGKKMTELIDKKRIVNVSLEGECRGVINGECEGFYFTDPPFTLLTTDVLPGIPMTRIKPLESYMPFSQSSIHRGKIRIKIKETDNMKLKIIPKKHEQDTEPQCAEGEHWDAEQGKCVKNTASEQEHQCGDNEHWDETQGKCVPNTTTEASDSIPKTSVYTAVVRPSADLKGNLQNVSQQTDVAMGRDPAESKPEGVWTVRIADPATSYPKEAVGDPLTIKKKNQPDPLSPEAPMPMPDSHVGPSTTPQPSPDLTTSKLPAGTTPAPEPSLGPDVPAKAPTQPAAPAVPADDKPPYKAAPFPSDEKEPLNEQDCGDGMHRDPESGECVPDDTASETVRRIKAEYAATGLRTNLQMVESTWIKKYTTLAEAYQKLLGRNSKQEEIIRQQQTSINTLGRRIEDIRVEMRELKQRHSDSETLNTKYSHLVEQLKTEKDDVTKKYQNSLATTLELSKKLTGANEDYLNIAKEKEALQEKLSKAKIFAKKTLKIKV